MLNTKQKRKTREQKELEEKRRIVQVEYALDHISIQCIAPFGASSVHNKSSLRLFISNITGEKYVPCMNHLPHYQAYPRFYKEDKTWVRKLAVNHSQRKKYSTKGENNA